MSDRTKASKKRGKRVRRSPEEARAVILGAAKELLAERGPDAIGLVDIASRAGVSHSLISHYFGSIDNVLELAFADHIEEFRARIIERLPELLAEGPGALIGELLEASREPLYGRLIAWSMLSGRLASADFAPVALRGAARLADAIEAMLAERGERPDRDVLEVVIILGTCATLGYSLAGDALWRGLGRERSPDRDRAFRDIAARMIARELGVS